MTSFSFQHIANSNIEYNKEGDQFYSRHNIHTCPNCLWESLSGMPGGMDAYCKNCGFKQPCCSD